MDTSWTFTSFSAFSPLTGFPGIPEVEGQEEYRMHKAHCSAEGTGFKNPKIFRTTHPCASGPHPLSTFSTHAPFRFAVESNYPFVANGLCQATSMTNGNNTAGWLYSCLWTTCPHGSSCGQHVHTHSTFLIASSTRFLTPAEASSQQKSLKRSLVR